VNDYALPVNDNLPVNDDLPVNAMRTLYYNYPDRPGQAAAVAAQPAQQQPVRAPNLVELIRAFAVVQSPAASPPPTGINNSFSKFTNCAKQTTEL